MLTGSFGVGKTSLFEQFINSHFSDKYLTTIGVKVSKKVINIDGRQLSVLLWDIAGEVTQDKVPVTYFVGAAGLIYVFDLTRPSTYKNLLKDIEYLKGLVPDASVRIAGNKKDLLSEVELARIIESLPLPVDITTSAKTGENVEHLFQLIGTDVLA